MSSRVESSKERMEAVVSDMNAEQRKSFFESFPDHPVLTRLNSPETSRDPMSKISFFLDMTDSDLDDFMKMQLVVADDIKSGGTLVRELASTERGKGIMGDMMALRSMGGVGQMGQHGHGSSGHVHGPGCRHHGTPIESTPDVATGKADKMDR